MSRESRFAALVIAGLAFASTAPAWAAVYTGDPYTRFSFTGPGNVRIAQPSAVGFSFGPTARSLSVQGIRVFDIPGPDSPYALTPESAKADVYVYRWNGTSWGTLPYTSGSTVRSRISRLNTYNNSVVLEALSLPIWHAGYYRVAVRISWFSNWYTLIGQRDVLYDSKPDYGAIIGNVVPGAGWILIN